MLYTHLEIHHDTVGITVNDLTVSLVAFGDAKLSLWWWADQDV
jgi:hypothetical protein